MDSEKLQAGPRDGEVLTGCDTISGVPDGYVLVAVGEYKRLHDMALAIVQATRPKLGYKPLLTGKQLRRLAE